MPDVELTELHDIKVVRQDGVRKPASGFSFLLMKAAASTDADGDYDSGCGCCGSCQADNTPSGETNMSDQATTKDTTDESTDLSSVRDADSTVPVPEGEAHEDVTKTSEAETSDGDTDVAKQIADAIAEVSKAAEERIGALEAELAVIKATPIPGGPMLTATASQRNERATNEHMAKAAYHDRLAGAVSDRQLARYHRERAEAERELAKA